ncbi:hypothetical protein OUZ56_023000 [Daphnia magna]|uniref:Uncharacterized protein n=1 Tax=Daphnia magna TaxID=35525 RepID=A0ABR0AYC7_9CRUS|nr:hypothetical protein OUZ56_023000 [Daphnia magna]
MELPLEFSDYYTLSGLISSLTSPILGGPVTPIPLVHETQSEGVLYYEVLYTCTLSVYQGTSLCYGTQVHWVLRSKRAHIN